MKTTYLTSLSTTLCPFSRHGKTPRLILSLLPPQARTRIAIKTTLLPRSVGAGSPATLEMGFKDGKKMRWEWRPMVEEAGVEERRRQREEEARVKDVVGEVERHHRELARKEELAG